MMSSGSAQPDHVLMSVNNTAALLLVPRYSEDQTAAETVPGRSQFDKEPYVVYKRDCDASSGDNSCVACSFLRC